jgi:hypothetical protein
LLALVALASLANPRGAFAHEGEAGHEHKHAPQAATKNRVEIKIEGDYRVITSNGLPDHATGEFPNRGNPNRIAEQHYTFRMPAKPQVAAKPTAVFRQPFGIALDGILFDPGTAEYWRNDRDSGWNYEALSGKISLGLDKNLAHVQPNGAYHYHGTPTPIVARLQAKSPGMLLLGYAADGFPIYHCQFHADADDSHSKLVALKSSYRLKAGMRPDGPGGNYDGTYTADYEYVPGLGDLDECNGRTGATPESPDGTYYYVITEEFPHIPRLFRGTPDASFERRPPPGGPRRGPPRRPFGPPPFRRPPQ